MSGDFGHPATASPSSRDPCRTRRLAAAALLVLTGALAVGGSFGAFVVHRFPPDPGDGSVMTLTTSGWRVVVSGLDGPDQVGSPVLDGIPLAVAGGLAVAAAVVLLRPRPQRVPVSGRALAVLAASVLVGTVAAVWLDLVQTVGFAEDATIWSAVEIGAGAWTILAAALLAVVAGGLAALSSPR